MEKRRVRLWLGLVAATLGPALLSSALAAAEAPPRGQQCLDRARECKDRGQWTEACAWYDQALHLDRNAVSPDDRAAYQACMEHAAQLRRHRDDSFLRVILHRRLPEALDAYEEVLARLQANYVERDRIRLSDLFQHGLRELRFALTDGAFVQEQVGGVPAEKLTAFKALLDQWPVRDLHRVRDAREEVRAVALAAFDALGLNPTVTVMEFAWGASNALDDYTLLLTPNDLSYVQATLHGEVVGVGLKVALVDQKLVVASLVSGSSAAASGLKPGDRVTRIDGQATDSWSEDLASTRLQGKVGSTVELEVLSPGDMAPHTVKLVRQALSTPSVEWDPMLRDGVGYVRILNFQETTVQELKDAVLQLQSAQMRVLILDLRGNGGGHFPSAIQVAEMFLPEGVIAFTRSPIKKLRNTYRSHNPSALTMPLVVLIDGDTASAAEVLAGALKENNRATLVGTATFGKSCIQCPVTLDTLPTALWVTVAKFYSPGNQPYNGRGITPHFEEPDALGARNTAVRVAQQLAMMMH